MRRERRRRDRTGDGCELPGKLTQLREGRSRRLGGNGLNRLVAHPAGDDAGRDDRRSLRSLRR